MFVEDHMRELLKNHVLEQILDTEKFKAFMLREANYDGRMMSTLVMFTPEGVVITGDLCPRAGTGGIVSDFGYGLNWFRGKLSEHYLCEKFLKKEWQREVAIKELRQEIKEYRENDYGKEFIEKLEEVADDLEREVIRSGEALYDDLVQAGYETADGIPGMEYNLTDAGLLCVIQQRFAELYEAMAPAAVAE